MESFVNIINILSLLAIPGLILWIVVYGASKKVKIYEAFIEGAKEGFNVGVRIIPYLVAMLVAIGIFRAGGAMELLSRLIAPVTSLIGMPAEALPMASRMRRSTVIPTSPHRVTRSVGSQLST